MYIGYRKDMQALGYECKKDIAAAKEFDRRVIHSPIIQFPIRVIGFPIDKHREFTVTASILWKVFTSQFYETGSTVNESLFHLNLQPTVHQQISYIEVDNSTSENVNISQKSSEPFNVKDVSHYLKDLVKERGGSENLPNINSSSSEEQIEIEQKAMEKLVKSTMIKVTDKKYKIYYQSVNKIVKRILNITGRIVSNPLVQRIYSELNKPYTGTIVPVEGLSYTSTPRYLYRKTTTSRTDISFQIRSRPARIRIVAEPALKKCKAMKRLAMKNSGNSEEVSTGIGPDGLSLNHAELAPETRKMEGLTSDRRKPPHINIGELKDRVLLYQDGQRVEAKFVLTTAQAVRKGYHISDMGFIIQIGKKITDHEKTKIVLNGIIKSATVNKFVAREGTRDHRELAIHMADLVNEKYMAFTNNPLYGDVKYFITYHNATRDLLDYIANSTDKVINVGLSPDERAGQLIQAVDKNITKLYDQEFNKFRSTIPQDARMGNKDIKKAIRLLRLVAEDQNYQFSESDILRYQHSKKFIKYQQNFTDGFRSREITTAIIEQNFGVRKLQENNIDIKTLGDLAPGIETVQEKLIREQLDNDNIFPSLQEGDSRSQETNTDVNFDQPATLGDID